MKWEKMDVEAWPVIAELLTQPWPPEAVEFDLRWWASPHTPGSRPSRRRLMTRWGWSDWKTRAVLKAQPVDISPQNLPTTSQPETVKPKESAVNLPLASTRAHPHKNKDILCAIWNHFRTRQAAGSPAGVECPLSPTRRGRKVPKWGIAERLKDHSAEELIRMIDWVHDSPHPRAVYLRRGGYVTRTLWRPGNCSTYVALAAAAVDEAAVAWADMMTRPRWASPSRWDCFRTAHSDGWALADDETEHARRAAAVTEAGGWASWCSRKNTDRALEQWRGRWMDVYRATDGAVLGDLANVAGLVGAKTPKDIPEPGEGSHGRERRLYGRRKR